MESEIQEVEESEKNLVFRGLLICESLWRLILIIMNKKIRSINLLTAIAVGKQLSLHDQVKNVVIVQLNYKIFQNNKSFFKNCNKKTYVLDYQNNNYVLAEHYTKNTQVLNNLEKEIMEKLENSNQSFIFLKECHLKRMKVLLYNLRNNVKEFQCVEMGQMMEVDALKKVEEPKKMKKRKRKRELFICHLLNNQNKLNTSRKNFERKQMRLKEIKKKRRILLIILSANNQQDSSIWDHLQIWQCFHSCSFYIYNVNQYSMSSHYVKIRSLHFSNYNINLEIYGLIRVLNAYSLKALHLQSFK
ncbi:unnamed protein product [Paramecium sonneborni]|uniref:Uncharacterized protein n=1 Tax=Paramecium sonneborni TaxID=65129 RepID=A0A8S1RNG8_9CILI|nr:unnamed protein product [Paramecium sonneborni]